MARKQRFSFLISIGIMSASMAAATVALACNDHSPEKKTLPSAQQPESTVQRPVSHSRHRPAWSQEMLNAHNQWRQRTGVPNLTWSDDLAKHAQSWAEHLANDNFRLYHRPNNPYGENLTWAAHQKLSPTQVVNMWGDEVKQYNYETNQCSGVCGHYTQLVWQKTTQVGCARVSAQSQEVWVCNYNPPGNYRGQKPYQTILQSDNQTHTAQVNSTEYNPYKM